MQIMPIAEENVGRRKELMMMKLLVATLPYCSRYALYKSTLFIHFKDFAGYFPRLFFKTVETWTFTSFQF